MAPTPHDAIQAVRQQVADISTNLIQNFSRTQMVALATDALNNAITFLDRELHGLTAKAQTEAKPATESAQTSTPAGSEEVAAGDATDQASEATESSSTGESAGAPIEGA